MNGYQKGSNYDEIFMQDSLKFAESLKDLKVLKNQLYGAAEYFEASYDKEDDHQTLVMESSKDYVAKALVSTVDHLGSVADKLNKFLDQKVDEFSTMATRFSCVEQNLDTFQGFVGLRGIWQHSFNIEVPKHNKQYLIPAAESFQIDKSKLVNRNCIFRPQYDMHRTKKDNPFSKAFQAARVKPQPPLPKKGNSRFPSSEPSPNPDNFSFMRVMSKKERGKHEVSPLRFTLKRSGSAANRSVSPRPSESNQWLSPSEPRRAMSVNRVPEMRNREVQIVESYTKRSKYLFKALLNAHRSRK